MFSLIYRSVAKESFIDSDIYKMLSDARDFNAEHHITGCLLYHDRKFLQLLEGEKHKVISLFNAIESDPRHQNVTVLRTEEREDRIFDRWSMAFYD
ncbi:MAG: BLUF domain-containing protein, partial [Flavobacteriaceae bacterium]